jgi:hypothetical protein
MIINILPQTQYNFSHLGSAATQDVIVADNIPVAGARTVALSVRVHQVDLASGANFFFMVYGVDPSSTDGTVFISSTSVNVSSITGTSPNLRETAIISDPIYPFMRVVLRATGGSTSKVYFETSADLVVREHGSRREAKLCAEILSRLYEEVPQARETLSNFPDFPELSVAEPVRGGRAMGNDPDWPKMPSNYCPTEGFWCHLKEFRAHHLSLKGYGNCDS